MLGAKPNQLDHHGHRFALHDYFLAKSVDALAPGGVMAVVISHFTLDKQNAAVREYLADKADFLGAVRLPSDAFKREGTAVATDIVFLRKRAGGELARHADPDGLGVAPLAVGGTEVAVNRYFLAHPDLVLGAWSHKDTLYGDGYSVTATGDLSDQLGAAVARLRRFEPKSAEVPAEPVPWIPVADIRAFAADLFGVPEGSVTVGNLPQDAVWSVDAGYAAERSVAATADSGTDRANGTWLLDLALNLKSPVIYDPVPGDPDKRQVNPEAPLAAKEKQQRIRNRFR